MNLPCLPSKKKDRRPTKCRKCSEVIPSLVSDGNNHICNSTVKQCYLNLPEVMDKDNPLDLENIEESQDHDEKLMHSKVKCLTWYSFKTINDVEGILCYTTPGDNPANLKIALPEDLIKPTIEWYHQVTDIQEARDLMDNYDKGIIMGTYIE
jgi:hypothetical protein